MLLWVHGWAYGWSVNNPLWYDTSIPFWMSVILLSSFIRWNVTNCITLSAEHMMPNDSLFYLAKLTKLIITAALYFKAQFHRQGLVPLLHSCIMRDFFSFFFALYISIKETLLKWNVSMLILRVFEPCSSKGNRSWWVSKLLKVLAVYQVKLARKFIVSSSFHLHPQLFFLSCLVLFQHIASCLTDTCSVNITMMKMYHCVCVCMCAKKSIET